MAPSEWPGDVAPADAEMVEQCPRVLGEERGRVRARWFRGLAVTAEVEPDRGEAAAEGCHDPVPGVQPGPYAMDQEQRRPRALDGVGRDHPRALEPRHRFGVSPRRPYSGLAPAGRDVWKSRPDPLVARAGEAGEARGSGGTRDRSRRGGRGRTRSRARSARGATQRQSAQSPARARSSGTGPTPARGSRGSTVVSAPTSPGDPARDRGRRSHSARVAAGPRDTGRTGTAPGGASHGRAPGGVPGRATSTRAPAYVGAARSGSPTGRPAAGSAGCRRGTRSRPRPGPRARRADAGMATAKRPERAAGPRGGRIARGETAGTSRSGRSDGRRRACRRAVLTTAGALPPAVRPSPDTPSG